MPFVLGAVLLVLLLTSLIREYIYFFIYKTTPFSSKRKKLQWPTILVYLSYIIFYFTCDVGGGRAGGCGGCDGDGASRDDP